MARDVRNLRVEASEAAAAGKHKKALAAYLELEQLEPRDANWSKRAAETYRRLGKDKDAVGAFCARGRSLRAERLPRPGDRGLQADPPDRAEERRRASPARADERADRRGSEPRDRARRVESKPRRQRGGDRAARGGNTALPPMRDRKHDGAAVRARTPTPPPRSRARSRRRAPVSAAAAQRGEVPRVRPPGSTPPPISIPRTKSKPIALPPDQAIETISLKDEVPESFEREENSGVYVIPIDEPMSGSRSRFPTTTPSRRSTSSTARTTKSSVARRRSRSRSTSRRRRSRCRDRRRHRARDGRHRGDSAAPSRARAGRGRASARVDAAVRRPVARGARASSSSS